MNADDFLKNFKRRDWCYGAYLRSQEPKPEWPFDPYGDTRLTADEWQEFKRKFVSHYGGEPIQSDGLTHSELLNYIATGEREGDEEDPHAAF